MKNFFIFCFLISYIFSFSQIKGLVKDKNTQEPLAFVNIVYNNGKSGTTTGIDGKFEINDKNVTKLEFSYLGYENLTLDLSQVKNKEKIIVKLTPVAYNIDEVVVFPGVNPAHRIIKNAVKNRKTNRPENLHSFEYTTYNKMIFTFDMALIKDGDTINSLDTTKEKLTKSDSALLEAQKFKEKQHLFMMESVSKRKFMQPDKTSEKVIATRVSGFKNPSFTMIATQMQSLTFYDDYINIMDKNYLSPISPGSTRKYFFLITDTLYDENKDTVFVISFRPRKGKNFDGLKGIIHINSNGYAVQSVKAMPYDKDVSVYVKIQQKYKKIENKQWFPVQLNTEITFKNIVAQVDSVNIDIVGKGKTYIRDIKLNPDLKKKEFNHIAFEFDDEAAKKDEDFWNKYRTDSLTKQEITTYQVVDSIGDSLKLDKRFEKYSSLIYGYFPVGYINIDLTKIISYNNFEGFTAGLRLATNDKVSKFFELGGYFRYGFKDYYWKYGGNLDFHLNKRNEVDFKIHYFNDVKESSCADDFYDKKKNIFSSSSSEEFRKFLIYDMFRTEGADIELHFRVLRYLKAKLFASYSYDKITNNSQFITGEFSDNNPVSLIETKQNFYHQQTGIKLKYAFKEKFVSSKYGLISLGTKYPVIYGNIIFGTDLFDAEVKYTKYELLLVKSFLIRNLGKTSISVKAGYTADDIPYIYLYNGYGSYTQQFTIEAQNTFSTIRMNEFLSNEFVYFFFRHNFKSLLFKAKWFQPGLEIATNIGFGDLSHKQSHQNLDFKTMEKGYYESGIIINNILKFNHQSFGIGAYYRYGPYAMDKNIDNFAFKLSFGYAF